ncbi:MAG: hypothetical protein Q7J44_21075 [Pseudotabrizicola sp.]|nr:hypothetical protein [Pseudotabrizicola sp.]MDO9641032.1 hypothetical protein [Pseudotabrizicola sp.]
MATHLLSQPGPPLRVTLTVMFPAARVMLIDFDAASHQMVISVR